MRPPPEHDTHLPLSPDSTALLLRFEHILYIHSLHTCDLLTEGYHFQLPGCCKCRTTCAQVVLLLSSSLLRNEQVSPVHSYTPQYTQSVCTMSSPLLVEIQWLQEMRDDFERKLADAQGRYRGSQQAVCAEPQPIMESLPQPSA